MHTFGFGSVGPSVNYMYEMFVRHDIDTQSKCDLLVEATIGFPLERITCKKKKECRICLRRCGQHLECL